MILSDSITHDSVRLCKGDFSEGQEGAHLPVLPYSQLCFTVELSAEDRHPSPQEVFTKCALSVITEI